MSRTIGGMERYEIRVAGHISSRTARALDCEVELSPSGESVLVFLAIDRTALYGLLSRLRDAGLELIAVERRSAPEISVESKER